MRAVTVLILSCLALALCGCSAYNENLARSCRDTATREGWHWIPASCFLTPSGRSAFQYSLLQKRPSVTLTNPRNGLHPVTLSWDNGKLTVACRNTVALPLPKCGRMAIFLVRQDGGIFLVRQRYQDSRNGFPHRSGGTWKILIAVQENDCLICWNKGTALPVSCRPEYAAFPRYHIFKMEQRKGTLTPFFTLTPDSGTNTQP